MEFQSIDTTTDDLNSRVDAFRCIVLNEAAQNLLNESVFLIELELSKLGQELNINGDTMQAVPRCKRPKSVFLTKPFFKYSKDIFLPVNQDAITRASFKETNICDDINCVSYKLNETEVVKLLLAIVDCYRTRKLQLLNDRREILMQSLTRKAEDLVCSVDNTESMSNREAILSSLQTVEEEIEKTNFIIPSALPKEVINAVIASSKFPRGNKTSLSWQNLSMKCGATVNHKFKLTSKDWLSILSNVHNLLTTADWEYISNHVIKGSKDASFHQLYWLHRMRPDNNREFWSLDELNHLQELTEELGPYGQWREIADRLGTNRTPFTCFTIWNKRINPDNPKRRPWSLEEDASLLSIIANEVKRSSESLVDWNVVGGNHWTRTVAECRSRAYQISPFFRSHETDDEFSSAEDLKLLKAVQRFGAFGGRGGRGTGLGVGSWAVIATELPGRTAELCEHRYNLLCEKFQPWSYAEDHKLFKLARKLKFTSSLYIPQSNILLPYFPGRSLSAIKSRISALLRWAKIHHYLCQILERFSVATHTKNKAHLAELKELKAMIMASPFFAGLVNEMRNKGESEPEEEAFSLLCSWKPRRDTSQMQEVSAEESYSSDFFQLLHDLENGLVTKCKAQMAEIPELPSTSTTEPLPVVKEEFFSTRRVCRILKLAETKNALYPALRIEIKKHIVSQGDDTTDESQNIVVRNLHRSVRLPQRHMDRDSPIFSESARLLLTNETVFNDAIESALKVSGFEKILYKYKNLRVLLLLVPDIAEEMIFYALDRHPPPQKRLKLNSESSDSTYSEPNDEPPRGRKRGTPDVDIVLRQKLLRIRRLLMKTRVNDGVRCSVYKPLSDLTCVQGKSSISPRISTSQSFNLPEDPASWLNGITPLIMNRFESILTASEDSSSKETPSQLTIADCISSSVADLTPSFVQLRNKSLNPIHPNVATISAFKTLLLRVTNLSHGSSRLKNSILNARRTLGFFDQTDVGSVVLPDETKIARVLVRYPDAAAIISSPRHQEFISRCFSLFIWPCILANLPAYSFIDSALNTIKRVISTLREPEKHSPNLRVSSYLTKRLMELQRFSRSGKPKNRKRKIEIVSKFLNEQSSTSNWLLFNIPSSTEKGSVTCSMPPSVQYLMEAGFVAKELSSI